MGDSIGTRGSRPAPGAGGLTGLEQVGEEYAASILTALREGIVIGSLDGRVVDVNDAFLELVGLRREDVIGVAGPPFPWHADPEAGVAAFRRMEQQRGGLYELFFRRPDGLTFPVQVNGAALRDRDGNLTGFLASCRDVGPLRRAEEEARRLEHSEREATALLAAEREARQMKDEFLAMVSHELRTPLTSVLGYQELAMADSTDPGVRALLEVAHRNGRHLARLVDDFLLIGRANVGELGLNRRAVSLSGLVREAVESARVMAAAAEISLEEDVEAGLVIDADAGRVSQVLDNLISNAIKFSREAGRVRVGARGAGERVEVTVSDQGPGIPPRERARIFDPFYRVPRPGSDLVEGNGLGLAVSKAIVEAHGGVLGVSSGRGETVFTAEWPRPAGVSAPGGAPRSS